jgi:hypothetical protein
MILYILNRFTFRNAEGFTNPFSTSRAGGLSNRAENEYRRVKLKYGRKKLEKMGLDPSKYSEDFIFALKISLKALDINTTTGAVVLNKQYSSSSSKHNTIGSNLQSQMATLHGKSPSPKQFHEISEATLDLSWILMNVLHSPNDTGGISAWGEFYTLYGNKSNLLVILDWKKNATSHFLELTASNFPNTRNVTIAPTNTCFDSAHGKYVGLGEKAGPKKQLCTSGDLATTKRLQQAAVGSSGAKLSPSNDISMFQVYNRKGTGKVAAVTSNFVAPSLTTAHRLYTFTNAQPTSPTMAVAKSAAGTYQNNTLGAGSTLGNALGTGGANIGAAYKHITQTLTTTGAADDWGLYILLMKIPPAAKREFSSNDLDIIIEILAGAPA